MSSGNDTAGGPQPAVSNNNFNPSMAIIIVVLIGACLVVAIFSMYIKRCTQGDDGNNNRGAVRRDGNQSIHFFERPGEGLERAIVDGLPMVSFSVVKTLKVGKEDMECAVCLESFEDDESLRLLPKCSHVFHTECIDEWFLSHSTCPLCRTSLKPTIEELNAGVPAVGEVSRRILEAQEELFGSARLAYDEDTVFDENEVFEGKLSSEIFPNLPVCLSTFVGLNRHSCGDCYLHARIAVTEHMDFSNKQEAVGKSGQIWKDPMRGIVQEWHSSETRILSDKQREGLKFGKDWPVFPLDILRRLLPLSIKVLKERQA